VLSGEACSIPKSDEDRVGMIRTLRVARRSAIQSTTQISNQIKGLIVTAPAELREQLRPLSGQALIETLAAFRPGSITTPMAATKMTLRSLARRHQYLGGEIATLNAELERLTQEAAPQLCAIKGIGPDVAGALLVAVGDNPDRLRSEASFAHLCGVAPLPASSGKTTGRHRLNRGGNRQANNALWRIVIGRLRWHQPTKEGLSKKEIIRCLKRYVAREVFRVLVARPHLVMAA
jgi:transposase